MGIEPFWTPDFILRICESNENKGENESKARSPWENPGECIVCLDNIVSCIITECYHAITCETCTKKLKHCPYCRSEITGMLPLIMPMDAKIVYFC